MVDPTKESEIRKSYQRAAEDQTQLSVDRLNEVNALYYSTTNALIDAYELDDDREKFNSLMFQAYLDVLKGTEDAVGEELCRDMYGETYSEIKPALEQENVAPNQVGLSNKDAPSI